MRQFFFVITSFIFGLMFGQQAYAIADGLEPQAFGWAERIIVDSEHRFILTAKLDTGADTSSLDARDMKRVRYKNKSYVRFTVTDPISGESISLRKPYVRRIRVKRHNGNHQRRYVVKMTICVGDQTLPIDVSLIDRGVFDYPMLLGRSALKHMGLVNPDEHFTQEPICWRTDEASSDEKEESETAEDSDTEDGAGKSVEATPEK